MLTVAGDIDLATSPRLREAVTAALVAEPAVLVLDLSAVTFLASTGLSVLLDAHRRGAAVYTVVRVVAGTAAARSITVTAVDQVIPMFTDLITALQAPAVIAGTAEDEPTAGASETNQ